MRLKQASGAELWSAFDGNNWLGFEPHFCSESDNHVSATVETIELDHTGMEASIRANGGDGLPIEFSCPNFAVFKNKLKVGSKI